MTPPPPPPGAPIPGAAGLAAAVAPAWKRIVARLLDSFVIGAFFGSIVAAFVLSDGDGGAFTRFQSDASYRDLYLIGLGGAAVGFVWDAVCTKLFGGTPMKLAFGMRVVQAETGAPVEWRHAVTRWAVPGALALVPLANFGDLISVIVYVVSLVFLFTKPRRQTVWDLAAKTVVVEK
jgi:uncharacterized RDD family membrane protein YckC